MKVLRTIAIVDLVANGVIFGLGALFGLSPRQSLGAALIMLVVLGTMKAWSAIVNASPGRRQRTEYLGSCDPVSPPLPPVRVAAEIVEPTRRVRVEPWPQIEAPKQELERKA